MKQLLLVGMIHLLILHQYNKDKKEDLANQIRKSAAADKDLPENPRTFSIHRQDSVFNTRYRERTASQTSYPYMWVAGR